MLINIDDAHSDNVSCYSAFSLNCWGLLRGTKPGKIKNHFDITTQASNQFISFVLANALNN